MGPAVLATPRPRAQHFTGVSSMSKVHGRSVTVKVRTSGPATVKVKVKVKKPRPNGVVLYRGPSLLNGKPIVCVAVGLTRRSKNQKTGGAIQTYILGDDGLDPI